MIFEFFFFQNGGLQPLFARRIDSFTDKNGDDLELVYTDYTLISIADEGFERVNFEFASTDNNPYYDNAFFMWFDGDDDMPLVFMLFNEKQIHMIHPDLGVRITPENADAIGFRGKELLGSSRGYIWSRTIPLLKECMVTGYGPDTFAYIFPQNDYLAKYYAYQEGFYIAVDKPHNLYLQIFFNNGLIALIAFLAICVFYLVDCFRLYALKKKYRIEQIYGISIMLAVVGYLAAGMFNDSVVAVAPVFWILLGVGAALNTINRRMDKNIAVDHDGVVVKDNTANKQKSKKQIKADEELNNRAEQLAKSLAEKRSPSTAVADISNGSEKVAPEELQRLGGTLNSDQQMMEMIEKSAKRGGGGVLTQEQRQELSKIIMQLRDEREASERKEKDNDNDTQV